MKISEKFEIELFNHKVFLKDPKGKYHRISKKELIELKSLIEQALNHENNL